MLGAVTIKSPNPARDWGFFYNIGTEELLTELPNRVILMVELFFKG
jgi:hypothetical protein